MQLKPERWLDHGEKRNTAALLGEKSKTAPNVASPVLLSIGL
jgi:hypothetical protein